MTLSETDRPAADDETLRSVLDSCGASFNPQLVDGEAVAALSTVCRQIPIDLTTFWGVESQLGHDRPEVDLLVEIKRDSGGHALLAGERHSLIDTLCDTAEPWASLRRFALTWADREHLLFHAIRNLWLEFDLIANGISPAEALARPCVFWGPQPLTADGPVPLLDLLRALGDAFPPFPRTLPRALLESAVRRLPGQARIFQLGAMHLRGDVVFRVCLNQIAPREAAGWLAAMAWPGDTRAIDAALGTLEPLVRTIALDVDFTSAGIGSKIGVEAYQEWTDGSGAPWDPLLDYVAGDLGLCSPAKRRAVAAFPAHTTFSLSEQVTAKRRGFLFPVLFRNIHHLKLAFIEDRFVEAKAYLGVARPGLNVQRFGEAASAPAAVEDGWYAP